MTNSLRPLLITKILYISDLHLLFSFLNFSKIIFSLQIGLKNDSFAGKVKKVPENRQYVNVTSKNFLKDDSSLKPPQELVVRIYILEDILDKCSASLDREYFDLNSIHSCIYVSASLKITLGLKVGSRVIVQMIEGDESPPRPSSVNIFPFNQSVTPEVIANYMKLHSRHEPLLLNSGATILLEDGERCVVRMSPADCDYAMIDEKDAEDLVVLVSSADPSDGKISQNCPEQNSRMEKISTR